VDVDRVLPVREGGNRDVDDRLGATVLEVVQGNGHCRVEVGAGAAMEVDGLDATRAAGRLDHDQRSVPLSGEDGGARLAGIILGAKLNRHDLLRKRIPGRHDHGQSENGEGPGTTEDAQEAC
jgi:hypothetical protein